MIGTPGGTPERPALFFSGPEEFRAWLEQNHESAGELWMGLRNKNVPDRGLTWADAVREALCFGWIDSKSERLDDDSRRQRWTPRRSGSTWSKINLAAVEELTAQGRMRPAGLAAYEKRREDRQGIYAYEQAETLKFPEAYAAELAASATATAWWEAAPPSYRKICIHWVLSAKQEATRESRMATLIEDCEQGRLIKSQRYGEEPRWAQITRDELGL